MGKSTLSIVYPAAAHIGIGDRPICTIAISLLEKALAKAEKALQPLRATSPDLKDLTAGHGALKDLFFAIDREEQVPIPAHLLRALRTALSLEYSATQSVLEDQQLLQMEGDETEARLKQLGRVLAALDVSQLGSATDQ